MEDNWISIKKELPPSNSWAFVCYDIIMNDAIGQSLDIAYYDGIEWLIGNKHKPYSIIGGKVTHWQKMPKLPSV